MKNLVVRDGVENDLLEVMELVKELAIYEKALDQVENTIDMMTRDGFGPNPIFSFLIAESGDQILGMSLCYYRYSTWKGKRLFLEDLIVKEGHRGKGVGKALFEATVEKARRESCTGMMWQVLDWNEPAINFYKKFGTRFDEGWINCHLEF